MTEDTESTEQTPTGEVQLLTRLEAVDSSARRKIRSQLFILAGAVAAEPGHVAYEVLAAEEEPNTFYVLETWASPRDAQRHADLVLNDGTGERVRPLLAQPLRTLTLATVASSTAAGERG